MQEIQGWHGGKIKAFINGVEFEHPAQVQVHNVAALPFIHEHVALMPDVHMGYGATVGSVIPTKGAIIPAAVGVDIGCGMMAVRTSLTASDLPDSLAPLRSDIERAVPHGGIGIAAGWGGPSGLPASVKTRWYDSGLDAGFRKLVAKYPDFDNGNSIMHLGSLGSGNHFIEVCLDEEQRVRVMLHSGSRGIGNLIGRTFTDMARDHLLQRVGPKPLDSDLAWFDEGTPLFDDYIAGMLWAQDFATQNREAMMERVLGVMRKALPTFKMDKVAVNCHHNYATREHHFGADIWVTRKGAVSAKLDELGIVPGSMGARSYITRGLGNADAFCSCPHGAGRRMSRGEAKRTFTLEDHAAATEGVECRKDISVIDETPGAYKDIDAVMEAASSLVSIEHTLKQVLCVKG